MSGDVGSRGMRRAWGCVGALVVVAVLAFAAGPAAARSLDAAGTTVIAFSDTHRAPFASMLASQLSTLKALYCRGGGDRGGPLSLNGALAVARRLVAADSRGRGLAAFARSRDGRTEATAIAAAAGALGTGRPAAALAALLRGHELAPRDPVPLIDAAPLLSQAGRGRAALALLDAAKRLKAPRTTPFGISWRAISDANRGQALIVTHQYAQAEKTLAAALKAAPLLREAKQNTAVVYDCEGNSDKAKRFLVAAVRRQTFQLKDYYGLPGDPFEFVNPVEVLDTSKGRTLVLPTINYPQSMARGKEQYLAYVAWGTELDRQRNAAIAQETSDLRAFLPEREKANPLTRQRTQDILDAIQLAAGDPDLAALKRDAEGAQKRMTDLSGESFSQRTGCKNAGLHGAWLAAAQAYDVAQRRFAVAVYRRQTALAANLKSKLAHQLAIDFARRDAVFNFGPIEWGGYEVTFYDNACYEPRVPQTAVDTAGTQQTPASAPCPSGIMGPGFTLNLLVYAFSADCEQVTIRVTIPVTGWLNAFGSISHNFRSGSNTVFVGPQLGVGKLGPLQLGARGGVFVTYGRDGSVQDGGLRAETSAGARIGQIGGSIPGPKGSISFAGAFTSP